LHNLTAFWVGFAVNDFDIPELEFDRMVTGQRSIRSSAIQKSVDWLAGLCWGRIMRPQRRQKTSLVKYADEVGIQNSPGWWCTIDLAGTCLHFVGQRDDTRITHHPPPVPEVNADETNRKASGLAIAGRAPKEE
jgi:hypothetical protein